MRPTIARVRVAVARDGCTPGGLSRSMISQPAGSKNRTDPGTHMMTQAACWSAGTVREMDRLMKAKKSGQPTVFSDWTRRLPRSNRRSWAPSGRPMS